MPDMTMCANEDCPLRKKCYRHADSGTKPTEHWQFYSAFQFVLREDGEARCPDFWLVRQ